ncbi:MAG: NifX-associated nitrogen fixation protein [Epsilonproteobacteria bacterium]|nr:NifX-associated nitrogen fixation protein [Campylobacterota bacterium]
MSEQTEINIFTEELVRQIRAQDQFGTWGKLSDDELLTKKYVVTKEDLKNIPMIADIDEMKTADIRMIFQAIALAFERKTGVMCNVLMEMSHEGFGRCAVVADKVVISDKYFKDAHRFGYRTLEKLYDDGEKLLNKAFTIYEQYKPCEK